MGGEKQIIGKEEEEQFLKKLGEIWYTTFPIWCQGLNLIHN